MGRKLSLVAIAMAAATAATAWVGIPTTPASAATGPMNAGSIYVVHLTQADLYDRGCNLGTTVLNKDGTQDVVAILDFGSQYYSSADGWMFTLFGGTNRTDNWARDAVKSFAKGFWICTGADVNSTLTVGLGTNNSGTMTSGGGAALASRAYEADNYATANYYNQVRVVGANDIEPGFGDDAAMRNWVDGYHSVSHRAMYNYGAADGCSTTGIPSMCNNGWSAADIWYASYYGANWPLPEIYAEAGGNAKQWKYLSLWSDQNKGYIMRFIGSMTQHRACNQYGGCNGTNNTPEEGWDQLYNQLTSNSTTAPGASGLRKTDIGWD